MASCRLVERLVAGHVKASRRDSTSNGLSIQRGSARRAQGAFRSLLANHARLLQPRTGAVHCCRNDQPPCVFGLEEKGKTFINTIWRMQRCRRSLIARPIPRFLACAQLLPLRSDRAGYLPAGKRTVQRGDAAGATVATPDSSRLCISIPRSPIPQPSPIINSPRRYSNCQRRICCRLFLHR
jgi:hypothetical protein